MHWCWTVFDTMIFTLILFVGSGMGNSGNADFILEMPIILISGNNTIDLLSLTVALQVWPNYVHVFLIHFHTLFHLKTFLITVLCLVGPSLLFCLSLYYHTWLSYRHFARRQVKSLCAYVSELHPPPLDPWESYLTMEQKSDPAPHLECPSNNLISKVKFPSFGTPQGSCGSYGNGMCSSDRALATVPQVYVTILGKLQYRLSTITIKRMHVSNVLYCCFLVIVYCTLTFFSLSCTLIGSALVFCCQLTTVCVIVKSLSADDQLVSLGLEKHIIEKS